MITDLLLKKRLIFDGGTGTLLQQMGLKPGEAPESWNLTNPEKIISLHKAYLDAGSDIICTNTFGVNKTKYSNWKELIVSAISLAKSAINGNPNKFIAFDMGPTGKLLEPFGELGFESCVELFAENVKIAEANGADLILIETMTDSYETKAAVLACKENCNLPIFVTNVYDESGRLMTGADAKSMVGMLEGLSVDALGINCSSGPDKMIPVVKELLKYSSVPVIVNPNAGLPQSVNGAATYTMTADDFSDKMRTIALLGASIIGGCCGTTPDFIKKTAQKAKNVPFIPINKKNLTLVSSYTHAITIGNEPILVGERINPTGKPKFKEALRQNNLNYILTEGINQAEKGVHILDVNVGLPEIDETDVMTNTVKQLQSVCDTPLQIDTTSSSVLESALRIYNGKALINSVNGDKKSMEAVFPLVKKYGGVVIALTLDENGIPDTPEGRFAIAERIITKAKEYGIYKSEIIVDPLALTISSDSKSAETTLKTIRLLKQNGILTSLGVSNISFGLPRRELINSVFFVNALESGLDLAIINPFSDSMMNSYVAFKALAGLDSGCNKYIAYTTNEAVGKAEHTDNSDLKSSIVNGLRKTAETCADQLLLEISPLDIINNYIIPALDEIGKAFELKKAYLPQLLMSAEAASAAFEAVKSNIPQKDKTDNKKVILATVKGDIHDIGKNIVKVMLESYGFFVIDLGRDVEPQTVFDCAEKENCRLVGLSALMTTTVPSMQATISLLHEHDAEIKVIVGGAVLTKEYADMINADMYAKDAMDTVRFAEKFYK